MKIKAIKALIEDAQADRSSCGHTLELMIAKAELADKAAVELTILLKEIQEWKDALAREQRYSSGVAVRRRDPEMDYP